MYDAFPLQWPTGYKRTPEEDRVSSQFKQTMSKAQDFLKKEIDRIDATDLIISTNIPVRKSDGGFYADWMSRRMDDPGVVIYFKVNGKDRSMCCDQYVRVWENMYALGKGLEALRGIERWGISEFLERAFTGFPALPESSHIVDERIWDILGLSGRASTAAVIRLAYKQQAKIIHPDAGGTPEQFHLLQKAYKQALAQFNERP